MGKGMDIGSFLEQQSAQGVQDSEGDFTVSHTNAARKLARFALPRTYAWVSKLVQGAVGWSCARLEISQQRRFTSFYLPLDLAQLPSETEIVSQMLSGNIGGTGPLQMFSVGLRAMVEQAGLSFLLVSYDGESEPAPVYAGHYFAGRSESERLSGRYRSGVGLTLSVAHVPHSAADKSWSAAKEYGRKIAEELNKHCYLSPVPIMLNGKVTNELLKSERFRASDRFRPIDVQGVAPSEILRSLPVPPGFETRTLTLFTHPRKVERTQGGNKGPFGAVMLVGFQIGRLISDAMPPARKYSAIHWVRAGVIVDSKPLPWETRVLSCQFFISAEDLPTDLTGFQLVESKELAETETQAVRGLSKHLNSRAYSEFLFQEDRDGHFDEDRRKDFEEASDRRAGILLKGGVGGALLAVLIPSLGVPLALGSILVAYMSRGSQVDKKLKEFRSHYTLLADGDQKNMALWAENWTVLPPLD